LRTCGRAERCRWQGGQDHEHPASDSCAGVCTARSGTGRVPAGRGRGQPGRDRRRLRADGRRGCTADRQGRRAAGADGYRGWRGSATGGIGWRGSGGPAVRVDGRLCGRGAVGGVHHQQGYPVRLVQPARPGGGHGFRFRLRHRGPHCHQLPRRRGRHRDHRGLCERRGLSGDSGRAGSLVRSGRAASGGS